MQTYDNVMHVCGFGLSAVGLTGDEFTAAVAATAAAINAGVLLARLIIKGWRAFRDWRAKRITTDEFLKQADDVLQDAEKITEGVQRIDDRD